jgi:hypothetical protein
MKYSANMISFLDVKIQIIDGRITTDLYVKPTDRQLYLHNSSDHPATTKKSIPYGLGLRIRRICSTEADYKLNRDKLKSQLVHNRGYNHKIVEAQLSKVDKLSRTEALAYRGRAKQKMERVPLVLTYSSKLPNIGSILHKRNNILQRSGRLRTIFTQKLLVAFRRSTNLTDILVHHKYNRAFYATKQGCWKCGKDCAICKHMTETDQFTRNGIKYDIREHIDCKSTNLVYGIHCEQCEEIIYVGETETTLYE